MEEIGKADEYGLRASDYALPKLDRFDAKIAQCRLRSPMPRSSSTSPCCVMPATPGAAGSTGARSSDNLDPTLALPDPLQLLETMAIRSDPAAYLRSFQPDQPQFQALRKALIAARGGNAEEKERRHHP